MKIVIDPHKCCGVAACVKVCPHGALSLHNGVAVVDHSRCDLDGICLPACPHQAISIADEDI